MEKMAIIDFVKKLQAAYKLKNDDKVGVFVVPVFTEAGEPTGVFVRKTMKPDQSMVEVMSVGEMIYVPGLRLWKLDERCAQIFGPTAALCKMYKAGQNIGGKIIINYCVNGINHSKWEILKDNDTGISCINDKGQVIYFSQCWMPNERMQDDPFPIIANIDKIIDARLKTE